MESIRRESRSARLLFDAAGTSFTLIDVGCSGGIDAGWRVFGARLIAYAFDPSEYEIARLSAAETNPNVHYINGFVGLPDGHPARGASIDPWRMDPWGRLSVYRTQELQQAREAAAAQGAPPVPDPALAAPVVEPVAAPVDPDVQLDLMRRNLWLHAVLADPDKPIVLPEFFDSVGATNLDFIKVDVDGTDFEILQSLKARLDGPEVLGVMLEVSFHGNEDPNFNTFHNVDRFMRARGFDLFDLSVRKYSLAALPRPYLFPHPFAAQTAGGRPFQGDALYLRDTGHVHSGRDMSVWSELKLLKLAALFALFGLLDHAAEILLRFRERLEPLLDIDAALDLMTLETQDLDADLWSGRRFSTYRDYMAAFEADDPVFYGADVRRLALATEPIAQRDQARQALGDARAAHRAEIEAHASQTARGADEAGAQLALWMKRCLEVEAELDAMRRSFSWRITRALRVLRRRLSR